MFNFLKVLIPNGNTKELQGVETFIVSWTKRVGEYNGDTRQCYQAFVNHEEAINFKWEYFWN